MIPSPRRLLAHSPLTRRILAVNLLAVMILGAGLLYLGEYRRDLIESEINALQTHGEIFAVALAESTLGVSEDQMSPDMASQIVRRLAATADTRARLFNIDGELVADSRLFLEPGGSVETEELPPPVAPDDDIGQAMQDSETWARRIVDWLPGVEPYPLYRENLSQRGQDYEEVIGAFQGDVWSARRALNKGRLMLSVAIPVQRYKQVFGVLLLSKTSDDLDAIVHDLRMSILQVFFVALTVTIALSLYLAGTIARPVRILAAAADRVRRSHNRKIAIPDLTKRRDEIGDLSAALIDMTDALWARMDAIEGFAADVAHEIKNPLTSLKSAVETATLVKDSEQRNKLLDIVLDDVARLDRLITDISEASRLDAEMSRATPEPVDLGKMLATLSDIHHATGDENTPTLVVQAEDDLTVEAVENRLVQVFRNLIGNAVTFSPDGGTIRLHAKRDGDWVVAVVEDEGPGIPHGKEAAIFQRFYTERPESEAFGKHSGLGLSISKQIVEAMSGTITAENIEPHGARFIVRLPAH